MQLFVLNEEGVRTRTKFTGYTIIHPSYVIDKIWFKACQWPIFCWKLLFGSFYNAKFIDPMAYLYITFVICSDSLLAIVIKSRILLRYCNYLDKHLLWYIRSVASGVHLHTIVEYSRARPLSNPWNIHGCWYQKLNDFPQWILMTLYNMFDPQSAHWQYRWYINVFWHLACRVLFASNRHLYRLPPSPCNLCAV